VISSPTVAEYFKVGAPLTVLTIVVGATRSRKHFETADKVYTVFVADEPVTKQDLLDMEGRVVAALKNYVDERSEKVETRLLTAFHGWARTM